MLIIATIHACYDESRDRPPYFKVVSMVSLIFKTSLTLQEPQSDAKVTIQTKQTRFFYDFSPWPTPSLGWKPRNNVLIPPSYSENGINLHGNLTFLGFIVGSKFIKLLCDRLFVSEEQQWPLGVPPLE